MPYTAIWDVQSSKIIIGGTLSPEEIPDLIREIEHATGTGEGCIANWYEPFMELAHMGRAKINAIRFWRTISHAGLYDAKMMIEAIERGEPGPAPNAFPHVSSEALAEVVCMIEHFNQT